MHPNPNKFLAVLFSFIPGAGHMYLGLMRRGASFMLAFAGAIACAGLFQLFDLIEAACIILIPVLWFVSFFDFWRYPRMSPEEKALVQDEFLIPQGLKLPGGEAMRKARIVAGILLIFAGGYQLYRQFYWNFIQEFLHSHRVISFFGSLPQLLAALVIIAVGLLLIFWKSRQMRREARRDEE